MNSAIETLRRVLRPVLGNSWAYRSASAIGAGASVLFREGPGTFLTLRRIRQAPIGGEAVAVRFRHLQHPLLIRPGTRDVDSIVSTIIHEDCGRFAPPMTPRTMIDAGAYIGDSTAYFLSRFPDLQVVALEPHPESYRLAEQNLTPYGGRVTLLPYALSDTETSVRISGEETGAKISDATGFEAQATTMDKLMERFPGGRVDILKIDIEGAEREIFLANPETWLSRVNYLIVETHGPGITQTVLGILHDNGWQTVPHRTQNFCTPPRDYSPGIRKPESVTIA